MHIATMRIQHKMCQGSQYLHLQSINFFLQPTVGIGNRILYTVLIIAKLPKHVDTYLLTKQEPFT